MFPLEEFFAIESFVHADLWKSGDPVWGALHHLESYLNAITYKIEIDIPPGVALENQAQIAIGAETILEPGIFIRGPCVIGKRCSIRHGAYLRGGLILGDGCTVGHGTELKGTILFNGATISHLCYVGDSILGAHVNLGAGVKCANLRLDRKEIAIRAEGGPFRTGLKKLGAILGDRVQVGCNCVLNPGTLIGPGTLSHPLLNLGGVIAARSIIKGARSWTVEGAPEKILEQLLR